MSERKPYLADTAEEQQVASDHASDAASVDDEKAAVHEVNVEKLHDLGNALGDNEHGLAPTEDLSLVMDKIDTLTVEESKEILQEILITHKWDYNFDSARKAKILALIDGHSLGNESFNEANWEFELKSEAAICKYYSPYPEVRAVTTPEDDPTILCETIRAHILGYIWAMVGQFINSLFSSRYPAITLSSVAAQVLLYPCGMAAAKVLPDWGVTIGGIRHSLNPGPWTYKEQMLSTIIINVSITSAYVFWNIQTQTVYYNDTWLTPGYKILLLLSTQMMGLGFAGLLRRFVVYPTEAIWPSVLPTLALNRALLRSTSINETVHGWSISTYKFFWIVFGCMFVYFWLPDFLFPALSYFAWMTWISPNNFKLAVITGSDLGMGFNPICSFDWNYISTYWYPLIYPTFSYTQQYIGLVISSIAVLIIYFNNVKWTGYLPPNSSDIFDNTGATYNTTRVIVNGVLDEAAFLDYSPAFYSAGNILAYSCFFLFYPLTFVFIIIDQWRSIAKAYRQAGIAALAQIKRAGSELTLAGKSLVTGNVKQFFVHLYHSIEDPTSVYDGFDDPFSRMMRKYAEVPDWWFLSIILISFIFAIVILEVYTELATPVWTIFFVIGLNFVFLVPMTYLYAISGTTEGLNVITELIVGYALPGHPEALMFVKAFGYNINGQADNYISDQKMGYYAKIPPRAMYRGQVIASIMACFVCYAVVDFVDTIQGICTTTQSSDFNCENGSEVYYASSVMWGLIGPKRTFEIIYPYMKYAFLVGFLVGLIWASVKKYGVTITAKARSSLPAGVFSVLDKVVFRPIGILRDVHPSLIVNGMMYLAPLNLTYATMGMYLNVFFMYWVRRNKTAWFEKYNYILSAALTAGVALSAILIFFAVQYNPVDVDWWGTEIIDDGVDGFAATAQTALITTLPTRANGKAYFGPETWS